MLSLKNKRLFPLILSLSLLSFKAYAEPLPYMCRFGKPELNGATAYSFANHDAQKGGHINIGSTESTFDSLNPFIVVGNAAAGLMDTFDPLMRRSPKEPFTLYANIAKTADLSKDNATITFTLDEKAVFHDGSAITSHDIKATVETLIEKGWPRYKKFYGQIQKIDCLDDHTIRFTFKPLADNTYDPEIPFIIASLRPLSKKQLDSIDLKASGLTVLTGSGPYKISKVDPGHSIVYERVKDYWAKDKGVNKGTYNLDSLKIVYYKNSQVHLNGFSAGDVNLYVPADQATFKQVQNFSKVKSGSYTAVRQEHALPVIVKTLAFNMRRESFQNPLVREALNVLFNFEDFNKVCLQNSSKRAKSLFANTKLAHFGPLSEEEKAVIALNPKLFTPEILKNLEEPYNCGGLSLRDSQEKASKLLDKAGFKLDSKGKRLDAKGNNLTFELIYKDPKLEKLTLSLKKSFESIGINLLTRFIDTVQYENRTTSHDFDMIVHCWGNSRSPGVEQSYYFDSKQAVIQGSSNYIGTQDQTLDWIASQVSLAKDDKELQGRVKLLDRYVMKNYFMIPLFYDNTTYIAFDKSKLALPKYEPEVGFKLELAYAPQ